MGVTMGPVLNRRGASEECRVVTWAMMGSKMEVGGARRCHCGLRWDANCGKVKRVFCLK